MPVTCISQHSGSEPACHCIVNRILEAAFQQPEKITYLSIELTQIQKEAIDNVEITAFHCLLGFYIIVSVWE